jgi:putative ABC transport system permease protein
MSTLVQDFRHAVRVLLNTPGFTLIAIIALALGIGANTAIFSVINVVLLRSLPFADPSRLALLYMSAPSKGLARFELAAPDYLEIRDGNHSFSQMGQYFTDNVNIAGKEAPEQILGSFVTIGALEVLGVSPKIGRTFTPEEGKHGQHRVAILSDKFWKRNLGGKPDILGEQLDLNGEKYSIVGVMPASFEFPDSSTAIWAPLRFRADSEMLTRGNHFMRTIARLKPGISWAEARTDVQNIGRRMARDHKENEGITTDLVGFREDRVGDIRKTLLILLGAVTLVLLIACANVANLLLARAAGRHKEIGMRAALGAGRWRLVRQFLIESVTLSGAGGVVGVMVAVWSIQIIIAMKPVNLPNIEHIAIDGPVLAYALVLAVLTGLVFGLFPALQASRADIGETLKETGRSNTGGVLRNRVRNALIGAEMAISLVLLIGAGLLIGSLVRLQRVDPGFRSDHVLSLFINLPVAKYPKPEQAIEFYRGLIPRLQNITGVQAVAVSSFLPFTDSGWGKYFSLEAHPPAALADVPVVQYRQVSPDYFRSLGIRLIRGRYFDDRDDSSRNPVAIVNESLAKWYFKNQDPIGQRVLAGFPESLMPPGGRPDFKFPRLTIVGVIGDTKQNNLARTSDHELYIPYAQGGDEATRGIYLTLRAAGDPRSYVGAVRTHVQALDKDLPLVDVATMVSSWRNLLRSAASI